MGGVKIVVEWFTNLALLHAGCVCSTAYLGEKVCSRLAEMLQMLHGVWCLVSGDPENHCSTDTDCSALQGEIYAYGLPLHSAAFSRKLA